MLEVAWSVKSNLFLFQYCPPTSQLQIKRLPPRVGLVRWEEVDVDGQYADDVGGPSRALRGARRACGVCRLLARSGPLRSGEQVLGLGAAHAAWLERALHGAAQQP